MKKLHEVSTLLLQQAMELPQREVLFSTDWEAQLNIILGLRGVGKTTQLLHQLNKSLEAGKNALYISLDDFYFLDNDLSATIETFYKNGGEYLFIDEAHYNQSWDRATKLAFDRYPRLKVTVTGSSAIKLYQSKADLSRRAHFYTMPGLSFREFLVLKYNLQVGGSYTLQEILENAIEISAKITKIPGIIGYFKEYLSSGYFPFCIKENVNAPRQLKQLIENIVDVDISILKGYTIHERRQVLKFLRYLVSKSPFELNISKVSSMLGIDRNKVLSYLFSLEQAELLQFLNEKDSKKGAMTKPDKLYLSNSNLYYALNTTEHNIGSMREAFAYNQLDLVGHEINMDQTADFIIDEQYVLEIGGRSKGKKQLQGRENAYIMSDDIEIAFDKYVPLWLLGFLY